MFGCGHELTKNDTDSVLMDFVPEINMGEIKVFDDSNEYVFLEVYDVTEEQFQSFSDECMQNFNIDCVENDEYLFGFDKEAQSISLIYYPDEAYFSMELKESKIQYDLKWKNTDYLPVPNTTKGKIESFDHSMISCYLMMNLGQYNDYIIMCKEFGYNKNATLLENAFYASDDSGNDLYLSYLGCNTISLTVVIK